MAGFSEALARWRSDVRAMGLPRPPCPLRVRLESSGAGCRAFVRVPWEEDMDAARAWLKALPARAILQQGAALLVAQLSGVPKWDVTRPPGVQDVLFHLRGDGVVDITATGARHALQSFGEANAGRGLELVTLEDAAMRSSPSSAMQDEALRFALAAGYYEVPRPTTLHALAKQLGISPASLSQRLRRAEAAVIREYVAHGLTDSAELSDDTFHGR